MNEKMPTKAEHEILTTIPLYTYTTIDQIMKHLNIDATDEKNIRSMQIKLKSLSDNGYIDRIERQQTGVRGRIKPAYRILTKAQKYLQTQGIEALIYDKPSPGQLNHVLAINEVIICSLELTEGHEEIQLHKIIHDYELKTMQLSLVPDAFLHFTIKTKMETRMETKMFSYPLLVEVDRGTESQMIIEKKIEAYLTFTDNFSGREYSQRFNLQSGTIVWFITGDEKRLFNIVDTIEKVLTRLGCKSFGEFFYLAQLANDPITVFLKPYFYIPFKGKTKHTLFEDPHPP